MSLPSSHPAPLVVLLHGYRQSAYSFVRRDVVRLAREGGYVLIAPRGGGNVWFQGEGEDDALSAIADVRARMVIDPGRIYLVGYSMGGGTVPFRWVCAIQIDSRRWSRLPRPSANRGRSG